MSTFDDATATTLNAYQQIASRYAERDATTTIPKIWRLVLRRFVDLIQESPVYQKQPFLPVLDVGCGTGRDACFLAQQNLNVLAVDIASAMLDEACKRCQSQPGIERITFRRMDMSRLELPDNSCLGLWASASFLHIPKRENKAVLHELMRVLLPACPIMLLLKECDEGEPERYEIDRASGVRRFFAYYQSSEIQSLLKQVGAEVLEVKTMRNAQAPTASRWLAVLGKKM